MALNLVEAAKTAANRGDMLAAGVIGTFARASGPMALLPIENIPGNSYSYNREGALPGIAFRGINESYTESTGVINPLSEALRIAGGDLDCDVALVKMFGAERRAREVDMKAKALGQELSRALIKGDSEVNPREFDGLQKRLTGAQLIENNAGTGAALSLLNLDAAIDAVVNPTHLIIVEGHAPAHHGRAAHRRRGRDDPVHHRRLRAPRHHVQRPPDRRPLRGQRRDRDARLRRSGGGRRHGLDLDLRGQHVAGLPLGHPERRHGSA